jgi:DNA polymerase-4
LLDTFAIETALLEICQSLIWRLHTHKWEGRTVELKIRYGDFTTFTVRKTLEAPARTMGELYSQALKLFYGKWQSGRGIRLLGVGLANLTTEQEQSEDAGLFDDVPRVDEKQRRLEETILQINRKFPKAASKKAQTHGHGG